MSRPGQKPEGDDQAAAGQPAPAGATNPYGSPPGSGISMPPYYLPTPSVKNKNNYFPQSEPLGPDEMRIHLHGQQPLAAAHDDTCWRLAEPGLKESHQRKETRP